MALINDITTLRQYVRVNFNLNNSALADISAAEQRFLVPLLGSDLYAIVLADVAETDSDYAELIEYCRKAVAPLAYWMDLPFMQTQITDAGVKTSSNDNMQAAHRWEFENLRDGLAEKGCFALENLIQYLFENKTFYDWTVPDQYNLIFQSAADFCKYFPLKEQPFRIFESLRVIIKQVEDNVIIPNIGEDFLNQLKGLATPNTAQAKVILLIKKAVANLAIKTAIETLPVNLGSNGFTVLLGRPAERSFDGEENAGTDQLSLLYKSVDNTGMNYLQQVVDYLNATASISMFQVFFQSENYIAPVISTIPLPAPNTLRKGIYGF